jgi:hypothetical protein
MESAIIGQGVYWTDVWTDNIRTVILPKSGTAGALLLESTIGRERAFVVVGVHDSKPWSGIITDVPPDVSAEKMIQTHNNWLKGVIPWKHPTDYSMQSARGTNFRVAYTEKDGYDLEAKIITNEKDEIMLHNRAE